MSEQTTGGQDVGGAPNRPISTPIPKAGLGATKLIVIGLVVLFFVVLGLIKLTEGPSTKAEVCASFDSLGANVRGANGFFDNAVFHEADDLASIAKRFPGPPDLANDASALSDIADSDATNALALMRATQQIGRLCGHQLRVF